MPSAWEIDGESITPTDVRDTPVRRDITFEVDGRELDKWREYRVAGDVNVIAGTDGTFRVVPDGSQSAVTVTPADRVSPPFDEFSGFINGFTEEQLAPDRFQLSLTIRRETERGPTFPDVDNQDSLTTQTRRGPLILRTPAFVVFDDVGTWTIDTPRGTLAMPEQAVSPVRLRASRTGAQATVTLALPDLEAGMVAGALATPAAIIERSIPDGSDFAEDISDGMQTTTLGYEGFDGPQPLGRWGVSGWALERGSFDDRPWRIELNLTAIDSCPLALTEGQRLTVDQDRTVTDCALIDGVLTVADGASLTIQP